MNNFSGVWDLLLFTCTAQSCPCSVSSVQGSRFTVILHLLTHKGKLWVFKFFSESIWNFKAFFSCTHHFRGNLLWFLLTATLRKWMERCTDFSLQVVRIQLGVRRAQVSSSLASGPFQVESWNTCILFAFVILLALRKAAHLLCLIVSCVLWSLRMSVLGFFFPHFCCDFLSPVHGELAVCLILSTRLLSLPLNSVSPCPSNTFILLNIPAFIHCVFTYWLVVRSRDNTLWNVCGYSDILLLSVSRPAKTCVVPPHNLHCSLMFLLALQDVTALDFKQFLLKQWVEDLWRELFVTRLVFATSPLLFRGHQTWGLCYGIAEWCWWAGVRVSNQNDPFTLFSNQDRLKY